MSALSTTRPKLFATGAFVRLWAVGGIANGLLWLEVLAASLFVFERTQSGWAVALVSAARAAPLLVLGAVAGVAADALDRKAIVVAGLLISAASAGVVGILAASGLAEPWHLGVAALVSGSVYATEMPARRRMVAESAGLASVDAAIAADSLTGYAARSIGPMAGGLAYGQFGLGGAFAISVVGNVGAALVASGLRHRQMTRPLSLGPVGRDLRDALAFAARTSAITMLLAVTVTMNLCGYSYSSLVAPVAKEAFRLGDAMTGLFAAAEPAGAFLGGLMLTRLTLPGPRLVWLGGGVVMLTGALIAAAAFGALGAPLPAVCLLLALGGLGSAVYTNNQTSIVLAETPPALRSRVMGLVTVCIGSWPLGMLLAGGLAQVLPPLGALATLAGTGLVLMAAIALVRARPPGAR